MQKNTRKSEVYVFKNKTYVLDDECKMHHVLAIGHLENFNDHLKLIKEIPELEIKKVINYVRTI